MATELRTKVGLRQVEEMVFKGDLGSFKMDNLYIDERNVEKTEKIGTSPTKLLALWKVSVKDGMHSPTCYVVLAKSRIDAIGLATARYLGESKSNEIYSVTIENIKGRIVDV